MKTKHISTILLGLGCLTFATSCRDLLDRAPLSSITPEVFFYNEADLAAYSINNYPNLFATPTAFANSIYSGDVNTDNQADKSTPNNRFRPGEVKVGSGTDNWDFGQIRYCNYFLDIVLPRWKEGKLNGNKANIEHYIGEMYFQRAWEYFAKVRSVGDYPIILHVLPDNFDVLVKANERRPRNEVMRQVISDLDSAIMLMNNAPIGKKNRLTKNAALLIKSRAALYEGSFLKSFKGTAYVPLGPGWPGATKEYNKNYQYPSGNIDNEINWFLDHAIDASDKVASAVALTANNKAAAEISGTIAGENMSNLYFKMFSDVAGQDGYAEVLLWKGYSAAEKMLHSNSIYIQAGGWDCGLTRGLVDSYVMENGLPIYAAGSGYAGDADFTSWRMGRDWRLQLFTKAKGDHSVFPTHSNDKKYPGPRLLTSSSESVDNTGYSSRKFMDYKNWGINGSPCFNGVPIMRAAEAYLNYIEAYYLRHGSIGGNADKYWRAIRTRAGIEPDYNVTIAATVMSNEAKNDWGAYTAGVLVDATLYNIRRERRCEFMSEGMRWNDLVRWRAMDQMVNTRYHIEGFNLWGGTNADLYKDAKTGKTLLKWIGDPAGTTAGFIVSAPGASNYLRPYQVIKTNNYFYDGLSWHSAHYLNPIGANSFLLTASDGATIDLSPIYQNPGWSTTPSSAPSVVQGF